MRTYHSLIDKMDAALEMLDNGNPNNVCLTFGPVKEYHEFIQDYIEKLKDVIYTLPVCSKEHSILAEFEDENHLERTVDV